MQISILDACFPIARQGSVGLAAMWLKHIIPNHVTPNNADVIFISCVATCQWNYVRNVKKSFPKKTIIVGGAASTSPLIFLPYCNAVCVGDGQKFIHCMIHKSLDCALLLPNVLTKDKKTVAIDNDFPWDCPPIQAEDGAFRVWAGRGCKNRCSFCQTGWSMPYSENPNPDKMFDTIELLKKQQKKISYLSNDLTQHSFFRKLPLSEHGSFSYRFIKKNGLPPARQVRLGVEGVSQRLRLAVNKPIPHNELVNCTSWLNANGKSVRWFLIAGLPGETDFDWDELRDAVMRWKMITPKGVLALSFTAWCPDPATPLSVFPIDDAYWERYEQFREWFFGSKGWSNRIKIMGPQQPKSRLKKAEESMCVASDSLYRGVANNKNASIVCYPFREHVQAAQTHYKSIIEQ